MATYTPQFESLDSISVLTVDARRVPTRVWTAFRASQRELIRRQIRAALPEDLDTLEKRRELDYADALTDYGDTMTYAERRVHPNRYRGLGGINPEQLYHRPWLTLLFDASEEYDLAGGVATVRNTSPKLPGPFGRAEQRLKMHASPVVPLLGGHRYEKVTDVVFREEEPEVAVAGIRYALANRPKRDQVSVYHMHGDPADMEMAWVIDTLDLQFAGSTQQTGIPGYAPTASPDRYTGTVGSALQHIDDLPGADAISRIPVLDDFPERWQGSPYSY